MGREKDGGWKVELGKRERKKLGRWEDEKVGKKQDLGMGRLGDGEKEC